MANYEATYAGLFAVIAYTYGGSGAAFIDADYTFDTNALTVGRNGSNIANAAADLVVNTEGAGFTLVYSGDATVGWTYRDK
jgi:hypothetical protein